MKKDYIITALLLLINFLVWSIVVFALGLFFLTSRVEALDLRWSTDSGWTNWETITLSEDNSRNNYHLNNSWASLAQVRENYSMQGSNIYDYRLDFEYNLNMIGPTSVDLFSTMVPYLYNGSNLVEITHKCQFQVTQYDGSYNTGPYRTIKGTMVCTQISGSGYYPYLVFRARQSTNTTTYLTTAIINISSSSLSINTSSTDSNNIINNNNSNTTTIINNNNANTDRVVESQNETTDSINDLNDTISDDTVDDPSSTISSLDSMVPTNGVVSGILLLPVQLYQAILNSLNGTCSSFNLGTLYDHNLTMPCINLSQRLGSTLYNVIDILICGLFILAIRKKFVDIFEHFTSLKTGGNELE